MFKKLLTMLLVVAMVLSLASCGGAEPKKEEKKEEKKTEAKKEEKTEAKKEEKTEAKQEEKVEFSVGLVTDVGGIDDKSFNQSTWEGILRFAEETGAKTQYVQSENDADYIPNLSTFSDNELDLIIAPGFLFTEALTEVSGQFPEQKYLIIDTVVEKPNVASAVFAAEQGSYLVGVASALKAKEAGKDTVGFLGGMDFDLIQAFEAGFEAGVKAVDENIKVLVEYAGSFSDTQIGQTQSAKMFSQGAYVIFHAAGGAGNGMIKEAKDRRTNGEDVWACGVDKDQYKDGIYEGEKSVILTSMMKRVDVASETVCKDTLAGKFPSGQVLTFDLSNNGVGLPAENPNLSDEIVKKVAEFRQEIVDGKVTVPLTPSRLK